jgi:tRNA-dihydrouridine synthase
MRYYFAPLEGITDSVFRNLHHHFYPGADRYYTPFLSPTVHRALTQKEQKEIPPAHTLGYHAVPQILTKSPEDFLWLAKRCQELGYNEVNLNLGCPSGTVTAKGKGSGMLLDTDNLDRFLDAIYADATIPVSVKTRIGFSDADEFQKLLDIYNQYPICELIIHPRVRNAFYNGAADMEAFQYAFRNSKNPLCYNGDIKSLSQVSSLPQVEAVMIGRGLVANPGMLNGDESTETLRSYLNGLLEGYMKAFGSGRNAMFRLKEHWHYLQESFSGCEKLVKQLQKATDVDLFFGTMDKILSECPFQPHK